MLIFYGYPSLINGARSLQEAATHFAPYSIVILGDGLQDPRHPNHEATRNLVGQLPQVKFFGYVDLGVHSPHHVVQNLEQTEICARTSAWKAVGVVGVLLDDYGYDFATTRLRQTEAVQAAHDQGLSVIANSWDPRHALDSEAGPANPKGLPSPLGMGDYYLYESYLVSNGDWSSFKSWRAKANTLARLTAKSRVEILSCTTSSTSAVVAEMWPFVSHCAWLEGHRACAWGEPLFSAGDNQAPWRERPSHPPGRKGPVRARGSHSLECSCAHGRAVANYLGKEFNIEPKRLWWERLLPFS